MPKRQTTVLVADDDLQFLNLVTLNLELEGYGVLRASDGRQALEQLERSHPDLALLDVMMPRMNGFAVCHRVRARRSLLSSSPHAVYERRTCTSRASAPDPGGAFD